MADPTDNQPNLTSLSAHQITQILDATDQVVIEHGPTAATLSSVARAAGITEDEMRRHFSDRDHLVMAAMMRQLASVGENPLSSEQWEVGSASDLFIGLLWFYADNWADRPSLARIWHEDRQNPLVAAEVESRITRLAQTIHYAMTELDLAPPDLTQAEIHMMVSLADHARGLGLPEGKRDDALLVLSAAGFAGFVNELLPPR